MNIELVDEGSKEEKNAILGETNGKGGSNV